MKLSAWKSRFIELFLGILSATDHLNSSLKVTRPQPINAISLVVYFDLEISFLMNFFKLGLHPNFLIVKLFVKVLELSSNDLEEDFMSKFCGFTLVLVIITLTS